MKLIFAFARLLRNIVRIIDLQIIQSYKENQLNHPNKFCRFGKKVYSQSDEDGLTNEIIKRIGIENGNFVELGVGDGTENNTLFLRSLGWSGLWVGGQKLAYKLESNYLKFIRTWITKDNIVSIIKKNSSQRIDLLSVDLDGNDYHILNEILHSDISPEIIILEYNARFIPPQKFIMPYNVNHKYPKYKHDDFFGASLESFNKLLSNFKYSLVCCNAATGANAFYVKSKYRKLFKEVPKSLIEIYSSPNYITPLKYGHLKSLKTIKNIL